MYASITPFDLVPSQYLTLDFSKENKELEYVNFEDIESFNAYVFDKLKAENVKMGIGGWLENRVVYNQISHFQGTEQRSYHLGVDIWMKAYSPIFCPENCTIHSYKNNEGNGDYGPTIILKSMAAEVYYLFGHLSLESIKGLQNRKVIKNGEHFAEVGPYPENGNWPPHLHFQVMNSMEGKMGDFPGVCASSELDHYKTICLNPYPYLGLPKMD